MGAGVVEVSPEAVQVVRQPLDGGEGLTLLEADMAGERVGDAPERAVPGRRLSADGLDELADLAVLLDHLCR